MMTTKNNFRIQCELFLNKHKSENGFMEIPLHNISYKINNGVGHNEKGQKISISVWNHIPKIRYDCKFGMQHFSIANKIFSEFNEILEINDFILKYFEEKIGVFKIQ